MSPGLYLSGALTVDSSTGIVLEECLFWRKIVSEIVARSGVKGISLIYPEVEPLSIDDLPNRDLSFIELMQDEGGAVLTLISKRLIKLKWQVEGRQSTGTPSECAIARYIGVPVYLVTDIEELKEDIWWKWITEGRIFFEKERYCAGSASTLFSVLEQTVGYILKECFSDV